MTSLSDVHCLESKHRLIKDDFSVIVTVCRGPYVMIGFRPFSQCSSYWITNNFFSEIRRPTEMEFFGLDNRNMSIFSMPY